MDNLTHTLFGITLSRTPLGRAGRGTTAALVLASNAPDLDAVAGFGGAPLYLTWHRGPTHGLLGVVGLGALTAVVVWSVRALLDRRRDRSGDVPNASLPMLAAASMIGVLFHILMDLPTSYGTRLLSPFDWHWFAVDWMPIIDVYLLAVLAAGTVFGRLTPASSRRNAAIVFTLVAAIYGVRAVAHHEALNVAPHLFGPSLPEPCDGRPTRQSPIARWPSDSAPSAPPPGRRCLIEIAALPTFGSPFRWRIVAHFSNAYELHDIDLLDARLRGPFPDREVFWRLTIRYPNVWTPEVHAAAGTEIARRFLGFSRFPAARTTADRRAGGTLVQWVDIRFAAAPRVPRPSGRTPFAATVQLDAGGRVVRERLGR
jgi:membrane-bound metal-dependent hydrolase YbcI (DUF457 family)